MSRVRVVVHVECLSFPRVSGDEPANDAAVSVASEFSPRERG